MRKVRNIRELQKKEKIRGLTRSAWGFSMLAPSWLIVFNPNSSYMYVDPDYIHIPTIYVRMCVCK